MTKEQVEFMKDVRRAFYREVEIKEKWKMEEVKRLLEGSFMSAID